MLKWTVGQGNKDGGGKSPSRIGPCYSIRRAAQKLSSRPNRRTKSFSDKENHAQCPSSVERGESPGTRDSVYMRLDSLPVALRDVSNYQTTPTRTENRTPRSKETRRRSRSQPRRAEKSPCTEGSPHRSHTSRKRSSQQHGIKRSYSATRYPPTPTHLYSAVAHNNLDSATTKISETGSPERKKQPCANRKCHDFNFPATPNNCTLPMNAGSDRETLQIEYSPCPLRSTQSLLTLRRKIANAFTLQSPFISIDNPIYFALNQSPTPSPVELINKEIPVSRQKSSSETPMGLKRFDASVFENMSFIDEIKLTSSGDWLRQQNEKLNSPSEVSPLARRLACLRVTSEQNKQRMQQNHDLTDPRFLEKQQELFQSLQQAKCTDSVNNDLNRCFRTSSSILVNVSNVETRLQHLPLTNHDRNRSEAGNRVSNLHESCGKQLYENNRHGNSELGQNNSEETKRSKRRGVVFSEHTLIFSTPSVSDAEERHTSSCTTSIDMDAPSTLRRQRVIRRRRLRFSGNNNEGYHMFRTLHRKSHPISCLTLPQGIPSPYEQSPRRQDSSNSEKDTSFVQLNNSYSDEPLDDGSNIHKKYMFPNLLGLTLPEGIPSPPSPDCCKASEIIPGIRPLQQTPNDAPKPRVRWKRKSIPSDVDESHCSEETWDSHQLQYMKTPKMTDNVVTSDFVSEASAVRSTSISKPNEDDVDYEDYDDAASSLASSPTTAIEGQSRTRRCLHFTSPNAVTKRQKSGQKSLSWKRNRDKGELELTLSHCNGVLTLHLIRGKNLPRPSNGERCNAYVKVCFVPTGPERTFHRTCVRRDSNNPRFDHKFSFTLNEEDLNKRILVSAWHRDRGKRRSEFLGCMSFAVKHVVRKEINGSFRLLSQTVGRTQNVATPVHSSDHTDVMANQSESSVEECVSIDESEPAPTPEPAYDRRKQNITKKDADKTINDDNIFLRHLELDPPGESGPGRGTLKGTKGGRTPFTTTRRLSRQQGASFGFSIAWTHPPRVERVEAGLPADRAGLRPGDYVIFVDKINVVMLPEEEILKLIKSCGNHLTLEIYHKVNPNGTITRSSILGNIGLPQPPGRSSTACSATTTATTSLELTKRRLHLPQVTFTSEGTSENMEEARRQAVYQLLHKEQQYALCLQFGISRFLLPLAERRDIITPHEHNVLFQNAQELLRLTEDVLEMLVQEEGEAFGSSVGRIYLRRTQAMNVAYRRYCCGLKRADCLLVEKTRNSIFMRLLTEPPIPRRRPDLTTFLHKPLEHYRDVLKILQTILNATPSKDDDYPAIARTVQEFQATYRDITVESGLMEPDGEGRPLLSLQDLESRLVFTRCKPFVLSSPGRQWIFGGDLSRVEGRSVRPFWALLFTDLLLFAKVSRDRVLFVTEEPLSLLTVSQALFSIRKKATEFRLMLSTTPNGVDSPAAAGCGPLPELPLSRTPRKGSRRRTVALRAPTPELKAVWQNLIQRQIIYLNTGRGGTPASSPLDSPDPFTADSVATLDSISFKRQTESRPQSGLDELIEHRCRQLGKGSANKGSALHLAQWMKGELGAGPTGPLSPETEPEPEIWSPAALRKRAEELGGGGLKTPARNLSRCEEIELSDHERSQSRCTEHSTSDSQNTVRSTSGNSERPLTVCRQCYKTCLVNNNVTNESKPSTDVNANPSETNDFIDDSNWGPLTFLSSVLSPSDPFTPVPHISILPPSPPVSHEALSTDNNFWDDAELSTATDTTLTVNPVDNGAHTTKTEAEAEGEESDGDEEEEEEEPPYRSLSPCGLRRFGTMSSLEQIDAEEESDDDTGKEQEDLLADGVATVSATSQFESVSQSLLGWTARAGSFVVEKMAIFEKFGEESRSSFIERYLRPLPDNENNEELAATSTSLAGEDECETSGGTSGDDIWGTPTSGDSELTSPTNEQCPDCPIGTAADDAREQLMMDELLGNVALSSSITPTPPSTTRGFPQRRRLEPLPEDVEDSTESSSPDVSECTKSFSTDQGNRSDSCVTRARSTTTPNQSFFTRLRLRRSHSADSRNVKSTKLLQFLRSTKSEDHTHATSSKIRLMRLFSRDSSDDIPTTMSSGLTPQRQHEKSLERRFWKQLRRRRRSVSGTVSPKHVITTT